MTTVTTTLVSGQNAHVGVVSSRGEYSVTVNSGVQGPTGNTGVSITAANVVSGNLVLTLSNTATIDAGAVVGANGTNGSNGAAGANGVSITAANVVSGNLVLTFSNSATLNVGTVVGANGANGSNGTNGTNGTNGVSVTAANVASGNLVLTLSNTSTIDAGYVATNVNATYAWTNTHTFSNTITFTSNVVGNTAGFAIGYRDIPQNFTNTSMTLALTDAGKHILTQNTGSSTQTITIANNTSVAFQTGAAITIVVQSTGTVAVANGAGVTMYLAGNSTAKSTVTLNSYSMATLLKIGTNTWMVSGTGAT